MFNLMVFLFFFFAGLLFMLWQMHKQNNLHFKEISEENAQLRILLRALESRLSHLDQIGTANEISSTSCPATKEECVTNDPLLHLSFDNRDNQPLPGESDLNLHLDDNA